MTTMTMTSRCSQCRHRAALQLIHRSVQFEIHPTRFIRTLNFLSFNLICCCNWLQRAAAGGPGVRGRVDREYAIEEISPIRFFLTKDFKGEERVKDCAEASLLALATARAGPARSHRVDAPSWPSSFSFATCLRHPSVCSFLIRLSTCCTSGSWHQPPAVALKIDMTHK